MHCNDGRINHTESFKDRRSEFSNNNNNDNNDYDSIIVVVSKVRLHRPRAQLNRDEGYSNDYIIYYIIFLPGVRSAASRYGSGERTKHRDNVFRRRRVGAASGRGVTIVCMCVSPPRCCARHLVVATFLLLYAAILTHDLILSLKRFRRCSGVSRTGPPVSHTIFQNLVFPARFHREGDDWEKNTKVVERHTAVVSLLFFFGYSNKSVRNDADDGLPLLSSS